MFTIIAKLSILYFACILVTPMIGINSHKQKQKNSWRIKWCFLELFFYSIIRHSHFIWVWSKIRTWDPEHWDLRPGNRDTRLCTIGIGTLELGPWDLGLPILEYGSQEHGTLTPGTLEMGPWGPETSNWPTSQIALTFFVKQILIIKT